MAKKKAAPKAAPKAAKAKKAPAKKAKAAPAPKEVLLVGSKVKAALRAHEVNVGEGTLDALNDLVHWYIAQTAMRAKANKRKTVRGHDVIVMDMYK